jgi:hypothetical protein
MQELYVIFMRKSLLQTFHIAPTCGIAQLVYRLDHGLDDRGFESRQGFGIFLLTTVPSSALGPIQPPIQWAPRALPRE